MFMTGFNQVTVRFGALDLVRGNGEGILVHLILTI
jgi:hypothetical protein